VTPGGPGEPAMRAGRDTLGHAPAGTARHGQSLWNAEKPVHGWYDVDLTELGVPRRRGRPLLGAEADLDLRCSTPRCSPVHPHRVPGPRRRRRSCCRPRHWRSTSPLRRPPGQEQEETTAQFGGPGQGVAPELRHAGRAVAPGSEHHPAAIPVTGRAGRVLPRTECLADVVRGPSPTGRTHRARPLPKGTGGRCWCGGT